MRQVLTSVLVLGFASSSALAFQARGGAVSSGSRINACSLLTNEVVDKVTPEKTKPLVQLPASGEEIGASGSGCQYRGIGLQIDPFARQAEMRKSMGKDWLPLSGVGETAYFRNNGDRWAELIVWSGIHHLTIQMTIPMGSTAESIKPNTIALANAIIAKLG